MSDIINILYERLTKEEREQLRDLMASVALDEFDRNGTMTIGHRFWDRDATICRIMRFRFPEPKPDPVTEKYWINVYPNGNIGGLPSKREADQYARPDRITCVEQEITYTPGEGV